MNLCNIVGGFLAAGILHMRGIEGKAGWRWLFMIEYVFHLLSSQYHVLNAPHIELKGSDYFGYWYYDILHDASVSDKYTQMVPSEGLVQ